MASTEKARKCHVTNLNEKDTFQRFEALFIKKLVKTPEPAGLLWATI